MMTLTKKWKCIVFNQLVLKCSNYLFSLFSLHDEIDKQGLQLKNAVKDQFMDCVDKVNESKKVFEDIKKKNQFYIDFVESFLNHGKNDDLVNLSTYVIFEVTCHYL